jgi:hypothetical protein
LCGVCFDAGAEFHDDRLRLAFRRFDQGVECRHPVVRARAATASIVNAMPFERVPAGTRNQEIHLTEAYMRTRTASASNAAGTIGSTHRRVGDER